MSIKSKKLRDRVFDEVEYEPVFNLLYCFKHFLPAPDAKVKPKKSLLGSKEAEEEPIEEYSNFFIWNIAEQRQTALFDEEAAWRERITFYAYATHFDAEHQGLAFNRQVPTVNNNRLAARAPSDALLLFTKNPAHPHQKRIWLATKTGEHLRLVAEPRGADWHIDVGNGVLRLLHQRTKSVEIEEIPWVGLPPA